jgi:hypothetical protein
LVPAVTALAAGVIFVIITFTLTQTNPALVNNTSGQIASISLPSTADQLDAGSSSRSDELKVVCNKPYIEKPYVSQTKYDDGIVIVVTNTPVYLMKPGTSGKLCIKYTMLYGYESYSGSISSQVVARTGDTKNVTITPYPDNITEKDHYFDSLSSVIQNRTSFDIVYRIDAPPDSTGFYGVWPMDFCGGLPFAIGYNASEINYSSDFAWKSGPYYGCAGIGVDKKIVGLAGIDVFYVTNQSTTNIGYEITGVDTSTESSPVNATTNEDAPAEVTVTFAVHFNTYNETINVIADARDFGIAHFSGNPQFEKTGQCSWVPTNSTALEWPEGGSIYDERFAHDSKYVKIDGRPAKIPAYTNDAVYTFNVRLTNLPEGYYALQPAIFVTGEKEPVNQFGNGSWRIPGSAIANYFPVTIGGMLPPPILMSEQGEGSSTSDSLHGKC